MPFVAPVYFAQRSQPNAGLVGRAAVVARWRWIAFALSQLSPSYHPTQPTDLRPVAGTNIPRWGPCGEAALLRLVGQRER